MVTTALPGFEDKSDTFELGIKQKTILSLNQVDFEKAFTNEPILFDITILDFKIDNPAVTVEPALYFNRRGSIVLLKAPLMEIVQLLVVFLLQVALDQTDQEDTQL